MKNPLRLALFTLSSLLWAQETPLEFTRLDLTDGRKLKNVVVKSYDAKSEKLLIVADGKAMTIPVSLIPAPFRQQLRADTPRSGGTTSVTATTPTKQAAPTRRRPVSPQPAAPAAAEDPEIARQRIAAHQDAAQHRARQFYTHELRAGSTELRVYVRELETGVPKPVTGWPDRYRAEGKALLDYYNTRTGQQERTTSVFEVTTEQKPGESPSVVDFTRKS